MSRHASISLFLTRGSVNFSGRVRQHSRLNFTARKRVEFTLERAFNLDTLGNCLL